MCCSVLSPEIIMHDAYIVWSFRQTKITRKASDEAENLQLYRVVRFFHPRSSYTMTHISADVQRITVMRRAWWSRVEEPNNSIYSAVSLALRVFLSFIVVELIQFFHGAIHFCLQGKQSNYLRLPAFTVILTVGIHNFTTNFIISLFFCKHQKN